MKQFQLIILLSLSWSLSNVADAQTTTSKETPPEEEVKQRDNQLFFLCKESFPKEEKGVIFLNPNWEESILVDIDGSEFTVALRYRVLDDEMQIQHLAKTKALYPQKIKRIQLANKTFIASEYLEDQSTNLHYFELLSEGNLTLLKRYRTSKKGGVHILKTSLYFKNFDEPADLLKGKKSFVLKLMKDKKSRLKIFMKNNKTDFSKMEDLLRLFDYYNSI